MNRYVEANAIVSIFCKKYTELKKDLPIRPSEMGVLNIIVQREGMFTSLMLAELLEVSKPMITAYITVLEKKGYIYKEMSKDDKRSFYIIPTQKGIDLVNETSIKMNTKLKMIETSLGEDKFKELLMMLDDINKILK